MSALTVEGERTAQSIGGADISTGAKYFGSSASLLSVNPHVQAVNTRMMIGAVVVLGVSALFVFRKRK